MMLVHHILGMQLQFWRLTKKKTLKKVAKIYKLKITLERNMIFVFVIAKKIAIPFMRKKILVYQFIRMVYHLFQFVWAPLTTVQISIFLIKRLGNKSTYVLLKIVKKVFLKKNSTMFFFINLVRVFRLYLCTT